MAEILQPAPRPHSRGPHDLALSAGLKISLGQHSDKGRKPVNQDFYGAIIPQEPLSTSKGVAIALADGISSSNVSQVASESAVKSFLSDYYCTSEAWSVKTSAQRVLQAVNSWLHSQTQRSEFRYDRDRGYVCTFSGVVLKESVAHLFHVGDARIYRLNTDGLEQLTQDHRLHISADEHYLSRALGMSAQLELDYLPLPVESKDTLLLMTDGAYEFLTEREITDTVGDANDDLDLVARSLVERAVSNGSDDNITVQIVRIDGLPNARTTTFPAQIGSLMVVPSLDPRMDFDGYRIVRQLYASARNHVYLAVDHESGEQVVIKIPSTEHSEDSHYLDRFLLEEWIARRIQSAHVLKPRQHDRPKKYLYIVNEYIEGCTLRQWMTDNPAPEVETVRGIVEQIARGLQAFHRLEMLHQDLRPENVMIDSSGTAKIIDFGSTWVAGLNEPPYRDNALILGTVQYAAPEYFVGDYPSERSDQFSLAVMTYEMLSGRLPYGARVSQARKRSDLHRLRYRTVIREDRAIPVWLDDALKKALQPDPNKRYETISEFVYDLRHPNPAFLAKNRPPLLQRNPVAFWQGTCCVLVFIILALLFWR